MIEGKEVPGGLRDNMALKAAPLEVETAGRQVKDPTSCCLQPGRGLSSGEQPAFLAEGRSTYRANSGPEAPSSLSLGALPVGQSQASQQAISRSRQGKLRPSVTGLSKSRGRQGIS